MHVWSPCLSGQREESIEFLVNLWFDGALDYARDDVIHHEISLIFREMHLLARYSNLLSI